MKMELQRNLVGKINLTVIKENMVINLTAGEEIIPGKNLTEVGEIILEEDLTVEEEIILGKNLTKVEEIIPGKNLTEAGEIILEENHTVEEEIILGKNLTEAGEIILVENLATKKVVDRVIRKIILKILEIRAIGIVIENHLHNDKTI